MRSLDFKRPNFFSIYECKRKALNAVATNQNLNISLRWWAQLEKSKLPRQSSLSRVHNINKQLPTSTNRVTCDLSSVGNQEGNNQMTQDTIKCPDRQLYTDISACYL